MLEEVFLSFEWLSPEWLDFATFLIPIAIFTSVAVTGGLSYWSIRQSKKQMAESRRQMVEQLKSQNKIASANLVRDILKPWRADTPFTRMLGKIEDTHMKFDKDEDLVHDLFTEFEDIAVFWKDKILDDKHVREFFGREIIRIKVNKSIMKILKDYNKKDPANNYNNLMELIEHSKCWNMTP